MAAWRRRCNADEGAAAVEFALILPLLVMFIFGTMQFGLFFYRWQGFQSLAHEGARGGSVGLTVAEITNRIENALSIPVKFDDVTIEVVLIDESTNTEVSRIDGKTTDTALQSTAVCSGLSDPNDYTVRVEVGVEPTSTEYDVIIPLWGSIDTDYGSAAVFGCESTS